MKTAVIIPALNEAENIGPLVQATKAEAVDWIIVVDNGSIDKTAQKAQEGGAIVVSQPQRGYGFACSAGTRHALQLGAEIIVYMDGDFSSLPQELPNLLAPIHHNEAELVLGSRTLGEIEEGAMPPHQKFGNWLSAQLMSWLYHVKVTDLGPYRAIRADLIGNLNMQEMTFGWPTEMMVKSAKCGARMVEVPVSWAVRRNGRSKVSGTIRGSILAAYYILGVTIRYAFTPSPNKKSPSQQL